MHLNSAATDRLFLRILLKNLTAAPALLKAVRPPVSHLRSIDFLLNHLKHVTGSKYAPWCSGPCASASHCCSAGTLGFDRACIRRRLSGPFGSNPHSHSVEHLLEHLHPLFSLFCLSCFVTLSCFVNSSCLLLATLLFHGFLGPNRWLFYFLHGHLARVSFNQIQ